MNKVMENKENGIKWYWKVLIGVATVALLGAVIFNLVTNVRQESPRSIEEVYFNPNCADERASARRNIGTFNTWFIQYEEIKTNPLPKDRFGENFSSYHFPSWANLDDSRRSHSVDTFEDYRALRDIWLKGAKIRLQQDRAKIELRYKHFASCFTDEFDLPEVK